MELVADKYYLTYSRVVTGLAALVLVASLLTEFLPSFRDTGLSIGLSTFTVIISALHVVFYIAFHKIIYKYSPWAAAFCYCILVALNIHSLMHLTGGLQSPWHAVWWLITIANGMFGYFILVFSAFLTTFYYVMLHTMTSDGTLQFNLIDTGILLFMYLTCLGSYFLWRKAYARKESQKISRLSGLVKGKETESEIIIRSISDGIMVVDTTGKVTSINEAAGNMVGWKEDEAVGIDNTQIVKVFKEDAKDLTTAEPQNVFGAVLATQKQLKGTMQLVNRANKQIYVSLVISPIIPEGRDMVGAVAVMRDISATRAEEQKRADFISTASHEMRTPVAAIEGYLALALNDKVANIDQKARAYLEKAHSSTQHLGKLFQDLLTSAKAEDGRLVSHPVVVELGAYLEQVSDTLRFPAEKKGLLVEYTVGATSQNTPNGGGSTKVVKPLYYVLVDPDRLREVITNLFDNAVKYTESGKISIGLTGNTEVVQLYIRDTGPGISAEDVPHLFQKFYRVDNSSTRTIGGTGLGLFICKKIIELYNGRIWVESTVGKGSTFFMNVPRLSGQQATELQAKEAASGPNVRI